MNCVDAAEYISTICDGETIPSSAAEHLGICSECQITLQEYLRIGVELRRVASLEFSDTVPELVWAKRQNQLIALWKKGLKTMRIPRLAFVVLIASIVALASSLVVVRMHARSNQTVVLLSMKAGSIKPLDCALSIVNQKFQQCGFLGHVQGNVFGYDIHLLSHSNGRVELGIRMRQWPAKPEIPVNSNEIDTQPEQHYWFKPGHTLKIVNPGLPNLTLTGIWMDHVPTYVGTHEMDPGPEALRIFSPILLRGNQVAGEMIGGMAKIKKPDYSIIIYYPKEGGYLIANSRIEGAIEANASQNRISFEENGQHFVFVTGAPITRAQHVWVLHRPNFHPGAFDHNGAYPFISLEALREAKPGIWAPTKPMK